MRGKSRDILRGFLQAFLSNRYAEAERAVEALEKRLRRRGEWGRGYLQALRGMLEAKRANDKYAFLPPPEADLKELRKLRREFSSHIKARGHADFDKGYFTAWRDLMSLLMEQKKATQEAQ